MLPSRLADPRGIALPLALLALMLLSILTLALLSMSAFEPLISGNLVTGEQARFVAEAGIEWAFNTLLAHPDWDVFLAGADPLSGAVLIADSPIPGRPASEGTYTVRIRNDSLAGDQRLTGEPADGGGPTDDTNSVAIITSVGKLGVAKRALRVVVRRVELPPIPAALAFPRDTAAVDIDRDFEIDGNDWTPDDAAGPCAPVFAISVGGNEAAVESALSDHALANLRGKRQDPAGPGSGVNTVASDATLTPSRVESFVASARNADIVVESLEPGGRSFADSGAACASSWSSSACWGTRDRPKVVYLKGNPDSGSAAPTFQISGDTEGHGILIVEDGGLRIRGNFRWNGLIIVTGSRVASGFLAGGNPTVYGAVIVNVASSDAGVGRGALKGNGRVRYSCQALDQARRARRLLTMRSWSEVAP